MSHSAQHKKMASLPVNESFIEKSIISELPESPQDQENVDDLQSQIGRLQQQLQFYRRQAFSKPKTEPFSFRDIEKIAANGENVGHSNEIESLRLENEEQKRIIRQISEQLRSKKKSMGGDMAAERERLEYINQKLQSDNTRLTMENEQLRKDLQEARMRRSELGRNSSQLQDYRRRNMQQQARIEEMAETALQQAMQIDALTHEIERLRRENVIDRNARKSSEHLRVIDRHNSRYSINTQNSRALSELDLLDNERLNILISEKNKEYEQLYLKYQSLENEYHAAQEINSDLERQRKFLAERLSDIEIHTEGDEIVGELENKLVLMSTELMRLGNLSRTKTQESKVLNLRIKELILKRQNLEKDVIERDKLILNYKEEIRIIEMRHSQRSIIESRVEKDGQFKEKNARLMKEVERVSSLLKEKSQALKNSDIKNAILEEKNMRLAKQNEQLQKENKQLSIIHKESKSIHTKVLNLQAEVNYYKEANSGLKDEMKRFQSKFYENRSDIEGLTREKELLRQNNLDLQQRIRSIQQEMRRMQLETDEKTMEFREISHKSQEKVMLKTNQIRKLEEKVMILEKEVQRSSKSRSEAMKYQELVKEIQRLEGVELAMRLQINTYQENLALLAQENQRLSEIAKESQLDKTAADKYKHQREQKDRKIKDLQKELESANAREKRCKEENEGLREKLRGALVQERESESWEFKNRQLRDQIDVLKSQISNKEDEIRSVNDRLMKERNQRFALQRKIQEFSRTGNTRAGEYGSQHNRSQQNTELRHLNNQLKLKEEMLQTLQDQFNKKDDIHSLLSAEVQRLNKALQKNVKQVMNYKKEVDFLQHKVRTCQESLNQRNFTQIASEKSIAEAESKTKIDICEGKIRNYEGQLELMRQRYQNLKKDFSSQQLKLTQSINEKYLIQQKANQLQYQLNQKSSNFRQVQDSFKLSIMEIKKSNERLEQSLKQIQNHYISRLEMKERECEEVNREKKAIESEYYELQKKYTSIEMQYGSEMKEKNMFITNLSTNHNQTKEAIAEIKRIKNQYQVKITLLSQELERLNELRDRQRTEIDRLQEERRLNESQLTNTMKESLGNQQTFDLLSNQIERLNSVLVGNVQKIKDHTKKSSRLQMENNQLLRELQEAKSRNKQHQKYMNEQRQSFNDRIQKLQQLNKELKYQLQEKTKDADRFLQRMKLLQKKEQAETNQYMRTAAEEMKLLREGNQKLESKLGLITREYEQLVTQLEYYKRPKSNEGDEKMRIIGNYQATIKHMKEENSYLAAEKARIQSELDKLTRISHQLQERGKISEQKARVFEQKCRRLDERCRVLQERTRSSDDFLKGSSSEKQQIQQKLLAALEQVGRLQTIIKAKQLQHEKLANLISNSKATTNEYYSETIRDKKGIFVIKQANEAEERSRSASGNGMAAPVRQPSNPHSNDLQYRYELLQSMNKKLSGECECLRKKNVEYEFKMGKLKEEFDLINRLIHEYRQENDKLKENNRLLGQRGNNFMSSQFSSPQHSSIRSNSHISLSPQPNQLRDREETLGARSKLAEEIDRLNRINNSLQSEIHDLRLSSTDAISLRKRHQENLALMVLLFTEVQSLRLRVRQSEKASLTSPRKP